MDKLTPCLWFDTQAEEAANYYASIFPHSKIGRITYFGDAGPREKGLVLMVEFELNGQKFTALNGGPEFKPSEATSFMVPVKNQEEFDQYWTALQSRGSVLDCGWVKDKYGYAWQIVPKPVTEMLADPDPAKSQAAMAAMLKMQRIDIAEIERAYKSKEMATV